MPKCEITVSIILITLAFNAFILVPPVVAGDQAHTTNNTFQNVTVDTAYNMITNDDDNLVILDVRYQSEYDLGHLYGAVLIPYDELEARISELEGYKNHEILVYCRSGHRSEIASEILVDYNFTEVYNMVGGILAWVEADYPIYTTSHHATVDIVDEEILFEIEPLLLHQTGCISCAQNQTCPSGNEPINVTSTVLEENGSHTVVLLTYEVNGTTFEATIANTLLWSYEELTDEVNRTVSFVSTEITADEASTQFYSLSYLAQHEEYNLTVGTMLTPLNSETYNTSFTIMNYAPAGKSELTSFEFVEFNSSVTLSQQYAILGKVAKEIGKVYEKSGNETLAQLAKGYYIMAEDSKGLSKLVEKELQEYDMEILRSSAVLMDACTFDCWAPIFLDCFGTLDYVTLTCLFGCAVGSLACGPFYPACLWGCADVCGIYEVAAFASCAGWALSECCF